MSNETVTYSLESVLKEIKDSIKEVNQKIDTFQQDVNQKFDRFKIFIFIASIGRFLASHARPIRCRINFTNLLELDPVPKTVEPKERRGVGYFPFL